MAILSLKFMKKAKFQIFLLAVVTFVYVYYFLSGSFDKNEEKFNKNRFDHNVRQRIDTEKMLANDWHKELEKILLRFESTKNPKQEKFSQTEIEEPLTSDMSTIESESSIHEKEDINKITTPENTKSVKKKIEITQIVENITDETSKFDSSDTDKNQNTTTLSNFITKITEKLTVISKETNKPGKNFRVVSKLENEPLIKNSSESLNETQIKQINDKNSFVISKEDNQTVLELYNLISKNEVKVFSQNREDGVILAILRFLDMNQPGYYVEFGTEKGTECNTRNLRENYKWKGLLMDGSNSNPSINLHKELISHKTILDLFEKYKVPKELDIFSEDTDYGDYWIVEKVLTKYKPKIVIHEVNQQLPDKCVTVPKPADVKFWDGSNFHGGSVCAFRCLAKRFDYTMVYCEKAGVNCFWIRNDLLEKKLGVSSNKVQIILTPQILYKKPGFTYRSTNLVWDEIVC